MNQKKNWLIRTQNCNILGPVSRQKVQELIENNAVENRDELCSGNGFWFFVYEQNLVQEYIFSARPQPFNSISEAQNANSLLIHSHQKPKELNPAEV